MRTFHSTLRLATIAGLLALACAPLGACGSDSSGGSNEAEKVQCTLPSDCPGDQICGSDGFCAPGFSGGDVVASGKDTQASDAGSTDLDATVAPKDGGGTKPGGSQMCKACTNSAECGQGWRCEVLLNKEGGDHFCVKVCSGDEQCTDGVKCTLVDDTAKISACIPPNYKCDGCAVGGCSEGQKCDFQKDPPVCIKSVATCGVCDQPGDCGPADLCLDIDGVKRCIPSCSNGEQCGKAASCQTFLGEMQGCSFHASSCCYGDSCTPSEACVQCPNKCVAGKCAECTKLEHCPEGTCDLKTHTCVKDACPKDKPHKDTNGTCVECLDPTHCKSGDICVGGTCKTESKDNVCKLCKEPYPACADINGSPACVECTNDDQCKAKDKGSCDPKTYTCTGTFQGGGKESGDCKTDEDCKKTAGATTKFDLACDTGTGLCYDKNGYCDNITAFCNTKAGSECKEQDLLGGLGGAGGGGMPPIPGLPGGGSSGGTPQAGSGVCTCGGPGSGSASCKSFGLTKCDCAKDPKSKDCDPLGIGSCCDAGCLTALINPKPDPVCFTGGTCMDMGCLFGALGGAGGGGGSSSTASGYCTGAGAKP